MANCVYCNTEMDVYAPSTTIIAGDAYCQPCLNGDTGHPGEWMWEPTETGPCKRCKREEVLGQFSRLCSDCADDMAS